MTMTEAMTFQDKLERYVILRDTIQGLEAGKDELGKQIKLELEAGEYAQTEFYRRVWWVVSYPLERFREVFGDAAALEVASIDRKRAEELAKAGDLDAEQLKGMASGHGSGAAAKESGSGASLNCCPGGRCGCCLAFVLGDVFLAS